jgi:phosphatidylglycerophosphate synthase
MLGEKREKFKKLEIIFGVLFSKLKFSPNQYTIFALVFAVFCFFSLVYQKFLLALIFFFFSALLDLIDGAVARYLKKETKEGAYLDTVLDRYVEATILLGFLFLPLKKVVFEAKVWIFLALFGSLMTTYTKAAAKEKELISKEMKRGFFGRSERMILIFLAIFLLVLNSDFAIYPILILALFSNLTSVQRIFLSLKSQI